MCRFLDAGDKEAPHAELTGVQKAPRHEVAGVEHRLSSERYGDLMPASGSMIDVTATGLDLRVRR